MKNNIGLPRNHYRTLESSYSMDPLQLAWYKLHHAGEQVTHWDIQNKENAILS